MSTAAGIAAVTAVLKDLLINGLIDHDANTVLGEVVVTATAPDRIVLPEQKSQLNLFLYLVTPNIGWRNVGFPSRDASGNLVSAPPLALDLHFLLSAYGAKDFHAELLLGYAMNLLHEMPVLSRPAIRKALGPSLVLNGSGALPPDLQDLFQSGLADQIEQIKVTPNYLTSDEMFRIWMAFQIPYRPTIAYHVSVVLIESERQGKSAPPVRARNVYAVPFRPPVIDAALARSASDQPFVSNQPILAGYTLALNGSNLNGEITRVLVSGQEVSAAQVQVSPTQIVFPLPASLPAGIQGVQVAQLLNIGTPPTPHRGVESNVFPFVLSPTLGAVSVNITEGGGAGDTIERAGTITITVAPPVGKDQRVTLLLNEVGPPASRSPRAYRFDAPARSAPAAPDTSPTVDIPVAHLLPGNFVARVQIDGAESPLGIDGSGRYAAPQVTIA